MKIKNVIIGVLLAFAAVFSGCAAISRAAGEQVPVVTAATTHEGIILNFENIQKDTYRVVVMLEDATENDHLLTYVDIRDDDLEALKSTGSLTCPYTEKGHVYRISIIPYSNYGSPVCINVAAISAGGVKAPGSIGNENTNWMAAAKTEVWNKLN